MSTTMQVYILTGEKEKQNDYISSFKKEKNITSYLVFEFEDFNIAQARNLQKLLSTKLHEDEFRLILIKNPTLDSQNALLKTLEELSENTFLFFLSQNKEEFLSTILSRALYIDLGSFNHNIDEALASVFLTKHTDADVVSAFEKLGPITQETFEMLILSVRYALFQNLTNSQYAIHLSDMLKKLSYHYAFSKSNNINKQMILDLSILHSEAKIAP